MPTVTRDLEITYGTYTVGGSTDRHLTGKYRVELGPETGFIEFGFVITESTVGDFNTEIAAARAAFRTPRDDITVTQEATTLWSFLNSNNSGQNQAPTILKQGENFDTGRSMEFRIRIDFDLPADLFGTSGRIESSVELSFDEARKRTLRVSGVYSAIDGTGARATYNAGIGAYITSLLTGFAAGVWEQVSEVADADDQDNRLGFVTVFEEVIFDQPDGLADPEIVAQVFRLTRSDVNTSGDSKPGSFPDMFLGAGDVRRLIKIDVIYEAFVDKDLNTDLEGKWDDIRSFVVTQAATILGAESSALVIEEPQFDLNSNKINVRLQLLSTNGSDILEYTHTTETATTEGEVLVPFWSKSKFSRFRYQGPGSSQKIVTDIFTVLEGSAIAGAAGKGARPKEAIGQRGGGGGFFGLNVTFRPEGDVNLRQPGGGADEGVDEGAGVQGEFILMSSRVVQSPRKIGNDFDEINVIDIQIIRSFEFAEVSTVVFD